MIIVRYLRREIFTAFFAVTLLLVLIFGSDQLLSYMRAAALGRMPAQMVMLLLSLQMPVLLTLLLPLSLFLAILLSYSRCYADNEMTVLAACGVGRNLLLKIALWFGVIVSILVAFLALYVAPKTEYYTARFLAASQADALDLIAPGRFNSVLGGKWVFYIEKIAADGVHLENVFAAEEPDQKIIVAAKKNSSSDTLTTNTLAKTWGVIFAEGGYQKNNLDGGKFLVLQKGSRYNGVPGNNDYQIASFEDYGIRLAASSNNFSASEENAIATSALWNERTKPNFVAELNWRISMPIAALILTIFAVPLSKFNPRYGRYFVLVPAGFSYILYANLMFVGRAWLEKGYLSWPFGMWWVHVLMLLGAIFLLNKRKIFKK